MLKVFYDKTEISAVFAGKEKEFALSSALLTWLTGGL